MPTDSLSGPVQTTPDAQTHEHTQGMQGIDPAFQVGQANTDSQSLLSADRLAGPIDLTQGDENHEPAQNKQGTGSVFQIEAAEPELPSLPPTGSLSGPVDPTAGTQQEPSSELSASGLPKIPKSCRIPNDPFEPIQNAQNAGLSQDVVDAIKNAPAMTPDEFDTLMDDFEDLGDLSNLGELPDLDLTLDGIDVNTLTTEELASKLGVPYQPGPSAEQAGSGGGPVAEGAVNNELGRPAQNAEYGGHQQDGLGLQTLRFGEPAPQTNAAESAEQTALDISTAPAHNAENAGYAQYVPDTQTALSGELSASTDFPENALETASHNFSAPTQHPQHPYGGPLQDGPVIQTAYSGEPSTSTNVAESTQQTASQNPAAPIQHGEPAKHPWECNQGSIGRATAGAAQMQSVDINSAQMTPNLFPMFKDGQYAWDHSPLPLADTYYTVVADPTSEDEAARRGKMGRGRPRATPLAEVQNATAGPVNEPKRGKKRAAPPVERDEGQQVQQPPGYQSASNMHGTAAPTVPDVHETTAPPPRKKRATKSKVAGKAKETAVGLENAPPKKTKTLARGKGKGKATAADADQQDAPIASHPANAGQQGDAPAYPQITAAQQLQTMINAYIVFVRETHTEQTVLGGPHIKPILKHFAEMYKRQQGFPIVPRDVWQLPVLDEGQKAELATALTSIALLVLEKDNLSGDGLAILHAAWQTMLQITNALLPLVEMSQAEAGEGDRLNLEAQEVADACLIHVQHIIERFPHERKQWAPPAEFDGPKEIHPMYEKLTVPQRWFFWRYHTTDPLPPLEELPPQRTVGELWQGSYDVQSGSYVPADMLMLTSLPPERRVRLFNAFMNDTAEMVKMDPSSAEFVSLWDGIRHMSHDAWMQEFDTFYMSGMRQGIEGSGMEGQPEAYGGNVQADPQISPSLSRRIQSLVD